MPVIGDGGAGGVAGSSLSNNGFFLSALNAPDLGLLIEGRDFAVTQEMTEEFRQDVTYGGGFGVDGPITRSVRYSDEGTITFTAVLLKSGGKLQDENDLKFLRDFEVVTTKGNNVLTYPHCNWTALTIRSTLDQVMIDATISIPGLTRLPK